MSIKYIDLDAIAAPEVVIKFKGKDHPIKQITFKDFTDNIKDIEALGVAPTPTDEINLSMKMILRAIPSLSEEQVMDMTKEQMAKIIEVAHQLNGQKEGEKEAVAAEAKANPNVPAAT